LAALFGKRHIAFRPVSERPNNANIGITLDTYSHCLPVLSEEAACKVAALVIPS